MFSIDDDDSIEFTSESSARNEEKSDELFYRTEIAIKDVDQVYDEITNELNELSFETINEKIEFAHRVIDYKTVDQLSIKLGNFYSFSFHSFQYYCMIIL